MKVNKVFSKDDSKLCLKKKPEIEGYFCQLIFAAYFCNSECLGKLRLIWHILYGSTKNNCMYQISKKYTKILFAPWGFFNFLTFCKESIVCMLAVNIANFVCKCRHLNNLLFLLAMRNNYSIIIIINWNTWSLGMFDTRHMLVYNLLHVELRSYTCITFQDLFLYFRGFFYSLYLSIYTEVYKPRIRSNSYTTNMFCSCHITCWTSGL